MKSHNLPKTLTVLFFAQLLLCSSAFARESESRRRENEQENHQSGDHRGDHHTTSSRPSGRPTTPNPAANNYKATLMNTTGTRYPKGAVKRKAEFRRGVLLQDRFSSEVTVAIPSTLPPVATLNDADALDVELEFSRGGTAYARCQLALHSIRETRTLTKAEFKVDIDNRVKKGVAVKRVRYGSCDTDLATPGNENAIPEVQSGDAITVSGNGQIFLVGQF